MRSALVLSFALTLAGCDLSAADSTDVSGDWGSEVFDLVDRYGNRLGTTEFSAVIVQHEDEITGGGLIEGERPFTLRGTVEHPDVFMAFETSPFGSLYRFDCVILRAGQMRCAQHLSSSVEVPEFRLERD